MQSLKSGPRMLGSELKFDSTAIKHCQKHQEDIRATKAETKGWDEDQKKERKRKRA